MLTVKDLVNLAWCPAKLWFSRHGPRLGWPVRHYGEEERVSHEELVEGLVERLRGVEGCRVEREPLIASRSLGLMGRPDAVLWCPGRCVAFEAKTREPGRTGLDLLQARAYASILALGECAGREAYAVIVWPGGDDPARPGAQVCDDEAVIVWPGGELRVDPDPALVAGLVRRARRVLRLPSPPAPEKPLVACRACEYRRVCPYSRV